MATELQNLRWRIVDDTVWAKDWVGLSTGDIYRDDQAFGYFIAAWYPNSQKPVQLLICAVNEQLTATLSVAFLCDPGSTDSLRPVEPECVPWGEGGHIYITPLRLSEIPMYTRASEVIAVASEVILQDPSLSKYVCGRPTTISASDA